MATYRLILLVKLVGVVAYAGGLAGAFLASAPADRRRAVHAVASPGLVVVWLAGYLLVRRLGVALTEPWIAGAFALSLFSLLVLVHSASRDRRTHAAFAAAVVPLLAVLFLMVFRPTWKGFSP
jgi:hypothetical protein